MKPVLALVGRPNVGKSTLFNRLTRTRDALVADQPGLTRDRQYGEASVEGTPVILVDTGGLDAAPEGVELGMEEQAWSAVEEADAVLFLVDARQGVTSGDQVIAERLRQHGKPVILLVNKAEGRGSEGALEFHEMGLGEPRPVSAAHGHGVVAAVAAALAGLPTAPESAAEQETETEDAPIPVAVVGRPNVGKSTLVNRLLGEERVLVYDAPGTTRDSIHVPFERDGRRFTLIDTAGVRRRSRVDEVVEKFSIVKTLQAVDAAQVVIMVLDAREGVTDQDAHLIGHALEAGRSLVLAVNKWDHLDEDRKADTRRDLDRRLPFADFVSRRFISALHGTGVGKLFDDTLRAWKSGGRRVATAELTRLLEDAVAAHPPPMVRGRRIKLRYAHQGGHHPPTIIIHGNQAKSTPAAYQRYLSNVFRKQLKIEGTPLRLEFKTSDNPYAGKAGKKKPTPRQENKRRRQRRHSRKLSRR
ncbi:MAG: ribosome biogenesis GTPase Der [Pseudomonadota bacterium]